MENQQKLYAEQKTVWNAVCGKETFEEFGLSLS